MTATPQLDNSIAGLYTKIISDAWYMDRKDTERLLDILKEMEEEVAGLVEQKYIQRTNSGGK